MTTPLQTRIAEVLALADKATPGPWNLYFNSQDDFIVRKMFADGGEAHVVSRVHSGAANAALIAAAPEMADLLRECVAEIERLQFRDRVYTDEAGSVGGGKTIAEQYRDRAFRAERHVEVITAENDSLRRDAERYRWLRDDREGAHGIVQRHLHTGNSWLPSGEELDAAIDAAMQGDKN